jgi:uncharacterized protein
MPMMVFAYSSPGRPTGFINDFVGVLTREQKSSLEATLSQNRLETGNEISVVLINNLGGDTVENFAEKLFKEWGIGQKGKDNGVLLLVAIDDHKLRIEVGYGLGPVLTDAQSGQIIRNVITPKFKSNDYYGGISDGVAQIIGATKGEVITVTENESRSNSFLEVVQIFGFMFIWIFLWFGSVLARSKSWWAGGILGGTLGLFIMFFGAFIHGLIFIVIFVPIGLLFDYFISKEYTKSKDLGKKPRWWAGGGSGFGGSGGGGFGGFGGGSSGGGGASGGW